MYSIPTVPTIVAIQLGIAKYLFNGLIEFT